MNCTLQGWTIWELRRREGLLPGIQRETAHGDRLQKP